MPADAVDKASENPIVLWIVIVVLAIVAILSGAKQIGGKVGEIVTAWTNSRRRAADAASAAAKTSEDADRKDMKQQIDYLTTRVDDLVKRAADRDRRDEAMDALLIQHQVWDRRVLQATDAGELVGPPPPLWPPAV